MLSRRSRIPPFWFFLLLAVALRWGSFFISVIDHDESTYIVIADELLRGKVYLRDVVDTKPIGIFWVYALLNTVTGGSIPLLRLATAAVIALGSWGLYVANLRATGHRTAGYVAGVLYVWMNSVFTDYGMSPNTEHYFNALTIWAVAISVAAPRKRWGWAGLLLGLAFIIKPFAAAEAGAVGLYLVWHYRRDVPRMLGRGLQLVATWGLPLAAVVAYYWWLDLLPALWFYSVEVSAAYPIELPWYLRLKYMGDYLLRYSPFILCGLAGARVLKSRTSKRPLERSDFGPLSVRSGEREWLYYLALQAVFVTTVILLTGKRFGHYQIQLHPVVALWVGATAGVVWRAVWQRRGVLVGLWVVAVAVGIGHGVYYWGKEDRPREVAEYFKGNLLPGEQVFGLGYQMVYHLLSQPVPVAYVHPSLLFYPHHTNVLGVNQREVVQQIIENQAIHYIYGEVDDPISDTPLRDSLLQYFEPYDTVATKFIVHRRYVPEDE
ncbi:ArnT family glycosyltransferase [Neolewinella sp.]|uniref:ArnT family glycosyltransferase n=1 Tax=Neolewinella sp. TaxID=2993543 RepID=UPI003B523860